MKTVLCIGGPLHRTRVINEESVFWTNKELEIYLTHANRRVEYRLEDGYYRFYGENQFFFTDTDWDDMRNCVTEGEYGIRREAKDL